LSLVDIPACAHIQIHSGLCARAPRSRCVARKPVAYGVKKTDTCTGGRSTIGLAGSATRNEQTTLRIDGRDLLSSADISLVRFAYNSKSFLANLFLKRLRPALPGKPIVAASPPGFP
jgi:hypothetical protein